MTTNPVKSGSETFDFKVPSSPRPPRLAMRLHLWQGASKVIVTFRFPLTVRRIESQDGRGPMVEAETFVSELTAKNQPSIQRLVTTLVEGVSKENFEVPDILRLILKGAIESAEVAALWMADCDDLELKLVLAEQCGDGAKLYRTVSDRLAALGAAHAGRDARDGGYSKLFAFLRSLQTSEERSAAGHLIMKALSLARLPVLAAWCEEKGDTESARLLREVLPVEESKHYTQGRRALVVAALTEESQARARRAAYRTIELVGEMYEPMQLRKVLPKRQPSAPK
jgi:hypothetical protein